MRSILPVHQQLFRWFWQEVRATSPVADQASSDGSCMCPIKAYCRVSFEVIDYQMLKGNIQTRVARPPRLIVLVVSAFPPPGTWTLVNTSGSYMPQGGARQSRILAYKTKQRFEPGVAFQTQLAFPPPLECHQSVPGVSSDSGHACWHDETRLASFQHLPLSSVVCLHYVCLHQYKQNGDNNYYNALGNRQYCFSTRSVNCNQWVEVRRPGDVSQDLILFQLVYETDRPKFLKLEKEIKLWIKHFWPPLVLQIRRHFITAFRFKW